MANNNLKQFIFACKLFISWRLFLIVISIMAVRFLPFKPTFPGYESILANLSPYQFIWQWANFDGVHYITLAEKGYIGTGLIQAFFPLFPLVIRFINLFIKNYLYAGLLISNLAFLLSLFVFIKLIREEKFQNPKFILVSLLLFPTSFYFGSFYSESLFLLFTLLTFFYLRKHLWFMAAIFASLSSATRIVGIFLAPAILWEFYQSNNNKKKNMMFYSKSIGLTFLSIFGFALFCFFLYINFGDPFYFTKVQNAFGASRETDKLILFPQVIWRYIKMIFTVDRKNIIFFTIIQEFILSLGALFLLFWGWLKKIKTPYLIYGFLSFILPTLTGNLSSMPRYLNLIIPIYLVMAQFKSNRLKIILLIVSSILLIINTALFLRGTWVA